MNDLRLLALNKNEQYIVLKNYILQNYVFSAEMGRENSTFPRLFFILIVCLMTGWSGVFQDGNNLVPTFRNPTTTATGPRSRTTTSSPSTGSRIFGLLYGLYETGAIDAPLFPDVEESVTRAASFVVGFFKHVVERVG